jgi:hypothetical protein
MTRLQRAGSWAPGVVTWRVSDRKAGFGAASLCALLDLLDDPGAPCLVGEALQTYLAHLDCGAGVVGAIEGEGQPVEGPREVASGVDCFVPQTYGLFQSSDAFEVGGEVVSDPPEELRAPLLACGLASGLSATAAASA